MRQFFRSRRLLLALFAALSLLVLPLRAQACSCGSLSPEESLRSVHLAFKGQVVRAEPVDPPEKATGAGGGGARRLSVEMRARFRVDTLWKGPASEEVEVVYSQRNGGNCGWSFAVGEEVRVFAYKMDAGTYRTSSCTMYQVASPPANGGAPFAAFLASYAATLDGLEQRLRADPADLPALHERAALYARYEDHDRAEAAFTRLLAVAPRDLAGLLGRAQVRYQVRQYQAALADFDLALAVSPQHLPAHKGRAMTLANMGQAGQLGPLDRDFSGFENRGRISLAGLDLRGASFQGAQLDGVDFTGADLRGADFSGATLRAVQFTNARLAQARFDGLQRADGTRFHGADASQTSFKKANLVDTWFDGAELAGADFDGAKLEQTSFKGAALRGVRMKNASLRVADLSGTQWDGADLSGADLRGAKANGAVLRGVSLRGAQIGFSIGGYDIGDWRGADLSDADLADVRWSPILTDCRTRLPPGLRPETLPLLPVWDHCPGSPPATGLRGGYEKQKGPKLNKTQAQGARLAGRDLSGFAFWGAVMDGSDLRGTNLTKADIQSGSWAGVRLDNATLVDALVMGVDFKDASFRGADLSGARLDNADLSRANLQSAKVLGTCFDARTTWPAGFDALGGGAKRC